MKGLLIFCLIAMAIAHHLPVETTTHECISDDCPLSARDPVCTGDDFCMVNEDCPPDWKCDAGDKGTHCCHP